MTAIQQRNIKMESRVDHLQQIHKNIFNIAAALDVIPCHLSPAQVFDG